MQLSNRLDNAQVNYFRIMNNMQYEARQAGKTVYDFSLGIPDFKPEQHVMEAVAKAAMDPGNYLYPMRLIPGISDAIIKASYIPVFCGVGGGVTQGIRTVSLAKDAEHQGAIGVVMNAPITNINLLAVAKAIDIPVVITITDEATDVGLRLDSGASILNVAAGKKTAQIIRSIRRQYPDVPIIATGGPTSSSILEAIEAGANAITYTPPTTKELFSTIMRDYRTDD